ncbi:MAG: HAD family hydrolase [Chloroflexi bacterium]|nr:HAD family hydrolase [Chloroflexota bacterium]
MLRAILFDLDDTLIDWSGFDSDWARLEREYLSGVVRYFATRGHVIEDLDAYARGYRDRVMNAWTMARTTHRAPHIGHLIMETALDFGVPADVCDMADALKAYNWGVVPGTVVFPDVVPALTTILAQGIKVGIVTNAPQPMSLRDAELTAHGLFDYFPICRISAADFGMLKPHPDIFKAALDLVGAAPDEAVFVGDDLDADIVGAKRVGIRAVLRITPRTADGLRTDVVPDARIHNLSELLALLDQWFAGWRHASNGV